MESLLVAFLKCHSFSFIRVAIVQLAASDGLVLKPHAFVMAMYQWC